MPLKSSQRPHNHGFESTCITCRCWICFDFLDDSRAFFLTSHLQHLDVSNITSFRGMKPAPLAQKKVQRSRRVGEFGAVVTFFGVSESICRKFRKFEACICRIGPDFAFQQTNVLMGKPDSSGSAYHKQLRRRRRGSQISCLDFERRFSLYGIPSIEYIPQFTTMPAGIRIFMLADKWLYLLDQREVQKTCYTREIDHLTRMYRLACKRIKYGATHHMLQTTGKFCECAPHKVMRTYSRSWKGTNIPVGMHRWNRSEKRERAFRKEKSCVQFV